MCAGGQGERAFAGVDRTVFDGLACRGPLSKERPDELSPIEPFGVERPPDAVVPEDTSQIALRPRKR